MPREGALEEALEPRPAGDSTGDGLTGVLTAGGRVFHKERAVAQNPGGGEGSGVRVAERSWQSRDPVSAESHWH